MPYHASQMYARNIATFLLHLMQGRRSSCCDCDDEITRETLVTHGGEVVHPRVREAARALIAAVGSHRALKGDRIVQFDEVTVCSSSCWPTFLGFEVIRRVSPLLHTPLMSLTNAISAIAVVGAIVDHGPAGRAPRSARCSASSPSPPSTINVVSGFLITDRMLKMFKTAGAREAMTAEPGSTQLPRRRGAVHPVAQVAELARHRAPRRARRRDRHAAGHRRHAAAATTSSDYQWIVVAFVIGSAIGVPLAYLMPMTAVPQRTALSHAFGALAAALVGTAEYYQRTHAARLRHGARWSSRCCSAS